MPQTHRKHKKQRCPYCRNSEYDVLFKTLDADRLQSHAFEIVRCLTCDLVTTRPFFDDETLSAWYRDKYHGWWQGKSRYVFSIITDLFQKNRFRWINRYAAKGARLFDIGYGDGTFINYMSDLGFETYGIENPIFFPQTEITNAAGDKTFELGDEKPKNNALKADIITFWHVLEHVIDPLSTLQLAHNMLNPAGLLIISSPNFNSFQSALFRDKWFHLDAPRHRWHFSPSTITKLLEKSGFSIIHLSHFSFEYNPFAWFQSLLNLCHCSHNFAYNLLKRGDLPPYKGIFTRKLYDIFCTVLLSSVFIPAACVLSLLESFFQQGGTFTIAAKKV
ncbi:MAG: class I SAM-dependent methyltransferase [Desulfobacterales bacterium]|nr:MAG: class I SAM-dependent methyltransferase [Desulfobacterales bacterium]